MQLYASRLKRVLHGRFIVGNCGNRVQTQRQIPLIKLLTTTPGCCVSRSMLSPTHTHTRFLSHPMRVLSRAPLRVSVYVTRARRAGPNVRYVGVGFCSACLPALRTRVLVCRSCVATSFLFVNFTAFVALRVRLSFVARSRVR